MPLTDTAVRNARPGARPLKLSDGGGMFLLVTPSGGKWWRLAYRFDSRQKQLSLGTYPDTGLKEARERRDAARKLLAEGIDPGARRKAARVVERAVVENTFEAVAREWLEKFSPGWAPAYAAKIHQRLKNDLLPWLGTRPVGEISAPDLLAVLRRIEVRGAVNTAHQAKQTCGQIIRYAVAIGKASRDPSGDLKGALPPAKTRHFAAIIEPPAVGELLRAMDGFKGTFVVQCALRLAPLFFCRPRNLPCLVTPKPPARPTSPVGRATPASRDSTSRAEWPPAPLPARRSVRFRTIPAPR